MYLIEASPISKGIREPSFTYHSSVAFTRGDIISVPLRTSTVEAIVLECTTLTKAKQTLRKERDLAVKSVISRKAIGVLDPVIFALAEQFANEYFISIGSLLAAVVPEVTALATNRAHDTARNHSAKATTLIGASRDRWRAFLKKNKGVYIIVLPTKQAVENCENWIQTFDPKLVYSVRTSASTATKNKKKKVTVAKARPAGRQCIITTPHEAYALILELRSTKAASPHLLLDMSEHIAWKDRKQPFISHAQFLRGLALAYGMPVSIGAYTPSIDVSVSTEELYVSKKSESISISYRDPESLQSSLEKTLKELWAKGKRRIFILSPRAGMYGYIECQDCKTVARCPSCGLPIGIAMYDDKRAFSCGHCGFEGVVRDICDNCHGHRLNLRAPGTIVQMKEVVAAAAELRPQPMIIALDKTIEKTPAKASGILAKSATLDHIVIGTSYVLEHATFDRFAAAIIMKPETLLAYPDYRTVVRVRLLLRRLADYSTDITCIDARPDSGLDMVLMNDEEFIKMELGVRKSVRMPPFARLCRLEYTGPRGKRSQEYIASLVHFCAALEKELGLTIRPLPILNGPKVQRFAAIITLPQDYAERMDIQRSLRSLPPWATCIIDPESISW